MPYMDSRRLLDTIRLIERRRGIMLADGVKIVVTTAKENADDCFQTYRKGCEYFLVKPVRSADVLECLRELGVGV